MRLFTVFLIFFVIGCKPIKHITTESAVSKNYGSDLNGKWQLQNLWGTDSSRLRPAFINFDYYSLTITGNTGCNSIAGKFSLKNEVLSIDNKIISTKMACPVYNDQIFLNLLLKVNRFNIIDHLLELSQDNLVLMTFLKK